MAGFNLFNTTHQLLEVSTRARAARHEVLGANIANADTPGYRPKDMDFQTLIKSALDSAQTNPDAANEIASRPLDIASVTYEPEYPDNRHGEDRLDGNGVSIDRQMALMSENALAYEASLTLLSRMLSNLRYAIGEGKR